jgi:hypothetical protein
MSTIDANAALFKPEMEFGETHNGHVVARLSAMNEPRPKLKLVGRSAPKLIMYLKGNIVSTGVRFCKMR